LREGISHAASDRPNLALARQILHSARRLYLILAVVVLVLLLTIGTLYIDSITQGEALSAAATRIAWCVFSVGVSVNLYFLWAAPLLMGSGRIHQNYLSVIIIKGGFAIFGAATLLAGGGLIALAAASLFSALLGAIFLIVVTRPVLAELATVESSDQADILQALWHNASRTGLVLVGGFLINRANVLIFSTFVGLTASARYGFTLQILSAAMAVAQLPTMVAVPRMTALRVQNEVKPLARLFLQRHAILLILFAIAAIAIGIIGPWALRLIGSRVSLLPPLDYAVFSVVLLLEVNSINCAYLLSTGNRVPFVMSALISGASVVILSLAAVWLGLGVLGALAAQGLVQLAYNNWKWPLEAWKELRRWI
jgi:O-antigen/teichoic acid export membrane protein